MAKYNEILVGRFARFLQKLTAIKGEAPVTQLAGEIMPSISFFNGAENRYLEGWDRFWVNLGCPAGGAANKAGARLRNPANSNMIAVIELMSLFSLNGADQPITSLGPQSSDLATVISGAGSRLDPRGRNAPTMILSTNSAATGVTVYNSGIQRSGSIQVTIDFIVADIQEIPVLPGDALQLQSNVNNQAVFTSWVWRERFLEDSERT